MLRSYDQAPSPPLALAYRCESDYLTSDHIAEPVNTATGAVYNLVALFIEVAHMM